ncbi:hypothetical protein GUITHDRAFT_76789 [Guillardia theta CCMP2712]|uniref:Peptide-methionine (R)-S-oxide reductase n=1 Tax=Guillardia theta (strain CCMP2712) TaxID=905079 RepID=L1IS03_GUITC|nr:hypothetical protein GUITHDRAFT_76789 [Guillardia theta CCMP2712]EKX38852.1 hypothetical protein GUITHDRAFT_76789 [Guillardia theta CCMP2712]|eukprot:XP_005825832.1 hypothetical protein GUITHDRAFT_76789 [Guillardia theta CCMP2712]
MQEQKLSREAFRILHDKGTERPFTSELLDEKRRGEYVCAACGSKLFSSQSKFNSGSGWPSFYDKLAAVEITENNVVDRYVNLRREVHCAKCGGHLGHLFEDGFRWKVPTGKRFCINGAALKFEEEEKLSSNK